PYPLTVPYVTDKSEEALVAFSPGNSASNNERPPTHLNDNELRHEGSAAASKNNTFVRRLPTVYELWHTAKVDTDMWYYGMCYSNYDICASERFPLTTLGSSLHRGKRAAGWFGD